MLRTTAIAVAAIAGTSAALALSFGGVPPARASGTAGLGSGQASEARGARVSAGMVAANAVALRVESAASAGHLPGFAGEQVSPSPTHPGVTIYWHGRLPTALTRLAAAAGTTRASGVAAGVTVRFASAPFSQAQLVAFENSIFKAPGFARAGVSSGGFYPQATGFWIGVSRRADLAKVRALAVIAHSPIPVHYFVSPTVPLTLETPARPLTAAVPGRFKDTPKFSGGDFIQGKFANRNVECSSGFGMHFANKRGAPWFMTTAGHCIAHSELTRQQYWVQGNKKKLGTTFGFEANDDVASIVMFSPPAARGAGGGTTIYVGNTSMKNSRGQRRAQVKGSARLVAGDLVSTSGAYSGERTRIKIKTTTWFWMASTLDGVGYRVFGARANKTNHSNAAGHGDSGGPVFINVKGGVKAVGIISATSNAHHTAACTGIVHRTCYWDINIPLMTGTDTAIEPELNLTVNVAR